MLLVELEQRRVHERVQPVEAGLDEVQLVPVGTHLQAVQLLHVVHHQARHAQHRVHVLVIGRARARVSVWVRVRVRVRARGRGRVRAGSRVRVRAGSRVRVRVQPSPAACCR